VVVEATESDVPEAAPGSVVDVDVDVVSVVVDVVRVVELLGESPEPHAVARSAAVSVTTARRWIERMEPTVVNY
jgi:hypothetical protein